MLSLINRCFVALREAFLAGEEEVREVRREARLFGDHDNAAAVLVVVEQSLIPFVFYRRQRRDTHLIATVKYNVEFSH